MGKPSTWLLALPIFLFTLGFEVFNNLFLLLLFALNFKRISIKLEVFYIAMVFSVTLLACLFFIENIVFLKYSAYLLRFLMLVFLLGALRQSKLNLSSALELVFFTLSGAVILCYMFPPLNNLMISYFSYNEGSSDRISGFIQGYEFVAFVMTIYLAYDYLNIGKRITPKFIIKLMLGVLASLFSGRYSMVLLTPLLAFVVFDRRYIALKSSILLGAMSLIILVFDKMVANIYLTILLVKDLAMFGSDYDFSVYSSNSAGVVVDGQYNLSPVTLFNEVMIPFWSWEDHIFPSIIRVIDSGPSYMILNLGFIFTCALYIFFFKATAHYFKVAIPMIVVVLFLLIDLKFRSLYVLMTTFWLLVNHVNYANRLEFKK